VTPNSDYKRIARMANTAQDAITDNGTNLRIMIGDPDKQFQENTSTQIT